MALASGLSKLVAAAAAQIAATAANSAKNTSGTSTSGSTGAMIPKKTYGDYATSKKTPSQGEIATANWAAMAEAAKNNNKTTLSSKTYSQYATSGLDNMSALESIADSAAKKYYSDNATTTTSNSGTSTSATSAPYTAIGSYNDAGVSNWAQKQIDYCKEQYNAAKASGNDDLAEEWHDKAEEIRANYGYSGGVDGSDLIPLAREEFEYEEPQPDFDSDYSARIESLLNQLLKRDDFSYDVMSDPLYQQYAQQYQREADRAMRETMSEAASGAGGMNSYAITAAQQANNYYGSQLNDKIPELYQLAYQMYLSEIERDAQNMGILQQLDSTQYNRYRDTMNDWYNDRNFAYNVYQDDLANKQWEQSFNYNQYVDDRNFEYNADRDAVADSQWDKNFEYNAGRDEVDDSQWNQMFDYEAGRDEVGDSRYEQEQARELVLTLLEQGKTPSEELIAQAGMEGFMESYNQEPAYWYDAISGIYKPSGSSGSTGSSSGSTTSTSGSTSTSSSTSSGSSATSDSGGSGDYNSLGIGPVSSTTLLGLIKEGKVIMDASGNVRWADGYNASNYR